jgi:hypothetical protein
MVLFDDVSDCVGGFEFFGFRDCIFSSLLLLDLGFDKPGDRLNPYKTLVLRDKD